MSNPSDSDLWVRPLAPIELFFEASHQHRTFLVCYHVILNTAEPLDEDHLKLALEHLCRKTLSLRLCIQKRDGVLWFREMETPQLDFQTVSGGDVQAVINDLRHYKYDNQSGPLWCCRLLLDVVTDAFEMEIPEGFGNMSHIFLGIHHGLQDALSNIKTCGWLTSLLNDVIAGEPINDEQLGNFVSFDQTEKVLEEKKEEMERDPDLKRSLLLQSVSRRSGLSLLRMAHPTPFGSELRGESLHLKHILDKATTGRFISRCKAEKVTVHAAFTALANVALIEVLKEKGILMDQYMMFSAHVVNLRRYWAEPITDAIGCHIVYPLLYVDSLTAHDAIHHFWEYARTVHADLKRELDAGRTLQESALMNPTADSDYTSLYKRPQPGLVNYNTSNIGEVTSMIPQDGAHARVTYFYRTISVNHTSCNLAHIFHTYRGNFIYVMDYNTGTVPKQTAQRYCQKIFEHLEKTLSES